jgi:tripartite-type tricarboxylate transporter receptor subunit TctC
VSARRLGRLVVLAIAPWVFYPAAAGGYPERPVHVFVGTSPGAAPDILARLLGQKLAERGAAAVVVENRPGAGGNLAGQLVAAARPDGYTLWLITAGASTVTVVYGSLGLDPRRDLAAVSRIASVPFVLVANPALRAGTLSELIRNLKARPGANYASAGSGSLHHLAGEQFRRAIGAMTTHVPYKSAAAAAASIAAGETDFGFVGVPAALPLLNAGRLAGLAVTTANRYPGVPALPTMKEAGLDGFVFDNWHGLMAPGRTPAAVVGALNGLVSMALSDPGLVRGFMDAGAEPTPGSAAEFAALVAAEAERWGTLAGQLGIRPE